VLPKETTMVQLIFSAAKKPWKCELRHIYGVAFGTGETTASTAHFMTKPRTFPERMQGNLLEGW